MTAGAARRGAGLGTKLVAFSTLLTVVAVTLSFLAVSVEIRRQTRRLLEDALGRHQKMVLGLQKQSLEQLLRTSSLMAESPTLRAAMETYRSESGAGAKARLDLLATIQIESGKLAGGLARDILVVTDPDGKVLASSGPDDSVPEIGWSLGSHRVVRQALEEAAPVGEKNFGILTLHGVPYQVGCVPILLQGYVIGTLTLGDRLDGRFAAKRRDDLGGEVVVAVGDRIVGSTMTGDAPKVVEIRGPVARVTVGREEYVAAPLSLGADEDGHLVSLCLLQSLTAALGESYRSMIRTLVACGLLAALAAGFAAWTISRSILRPFDRFVAFLRSVAETGERSQRFDAGDAGAEVRLLNETYGRLIESLDRHERRLLQAAQDELGRVARLKETEKLAALGRMLSGAAHEINNPLTGVVGNLQLLLARNLPDDALRARIEKVHHEAQRIVALVRNLLKVSHRDGGDRSIVDANRLVSETVELRRHDFVAAGLRIELDLTSDRARLFGNELELQQVVLNIINNAFDALMESAPSAPCLTIRTEATEGAVIVTFQDNGPGIKEPGKVFDHFYTTKEVGKGTGLGLSISHAIVRSHGGSITAENDSRGGARFTISLPSTTGAGLGATPVAAAPNPAPPARSISASVLVVEDEAEVLDLELEILRSLGASVQGVRSGSEAINLLQTECFDLIVSDLKMPGGVSGHELFVWTRAHQPAMADRFVFVTGDTASESTREFLGASGRRCVLKPFSPEELVAVVAESLGAARRAS